MTLMRDDVDVEVDGVLAVRCANGDPDAFAELYQRYRARLYRVCLRRLGDPHDADDAVQETFTRAWRAMGRFDGSWRVYPWLRTIAGNVCIDVMRRRKRVQTAVLDESHDDHGGGSDPFDAFLAALHARWALDRLAAVIDDLPERYRETLVLHEVEGLTSRQIASQHGTTVRAVETVLLRARRILRSAMETPAASAFLGLTAAATRWVRWHTTAPTLHRGARLARLLPSGAAATGVVAFTLYSVLAPSAPTPVAPIPSIPSVPISVAGPLPLGATGTPQATAATQPTAAASGGSSSAVVAAGWTPTKAVVVGPAAGPEAAAGRQPLHTTGDGVFLGADPVEVVQQSLGDLGTYLHQFMTPPAGG